MDKHTPKDAILFFISLPYIFHLFLCSFYSPYTRTSDYEFEIGFGIEFACGHLFFWCLFSYVFSVLFYFERRFGRISWALVFTIYYLSSVATTPCYICYPIFLCELFLLSIFISISISIRFWLYIF
jgi:hypothetical protein